MQLQPKKCITFMYFITLTWERVEWQFRWFRVSFSQKSWFSSSCVPDKNMPSVELKWNVHGSPYTSIYFLLFRLFQCAPNIKQQLWHHQAVDGGGINIQQTFCNALWFPVKWVESQVPFDNRVSKFCGVNCQNIPLVYVFVAFVE